MDGVSGREKSRRKKQRTVDEPVDSNPSVSTNRRGEEEDREEDFQTQMPFVCVCRVCPTPKPVEHGTGGGL
jgi:hypothetical protein